jgi:hypothetical protein
MIPSQLQGKQDTDRNAATTRSPKGAYQTTLFQIRVLEVKALLSLSGRDTPSRYARSSAPLGSVGGRYWLRGLGHIPS